MNEDIEHIIRNDCQGRPLEGGRSYQLRLPSPIPACDFWSVVVYDIITGLIIHNDQAWPSVHSNCKNLVINQDGSVVIRFGPDPPAGIRQNWIQTITGMEWYLIVRFYELADSLPDKSWSPGKVEETGI